MTELNMDKSDLGPKLENLRGGAALRYLINSDAVTVLDIGSGSGTHAALLRESGKQVTTLAMTPPADYIADFVGWNDPRIDWDAIWASHVLEHTRNPGMFLDECYRRLKMGGRLYVTVPPAKHNIVGGHVSIWNAGLLVYHLVLAGFDCSKARIGAYGYNISCIVEKTAIALPRLDHDSGDITRLEPFFPAGFREGMSGEIEQCWEEAA